MLADRYSELHPSDETDLIGSVIDTSDEDNGGHKIAKTHLNSDKSIRDS